MPAGAKAVALVMLGCAGVAGGGGPPTPHPLGGPGAIVIYEDHRSAEGDTLRYTLRWGAGAGATSYGVRVTAGTAGWSGLPSGAVAGGTSHTFAAINLTAWGSGLSGRGRQQRR